MAHLKLDTVDGATVGDVIGAGDGRGVVGTADGGELGVALGTNVVGCHDGAFD